MSTSPAYRLISSLLPRVLPRRSVAFARRQIQTCSPRFQVRSSNEDGLAQAKDIPWYLRDESTGNPSLPSHQPESIASPSRSPNFLPYNANTTLATPATPIQIQPLPPSAPSSIEPLHGFLITDSLFASQSVAVLSTSNPADLSVTDQVEPENNWLSTNVTGQGKRGRGKKSSGPGFIVEGFDVGGNWEWMVTAEVRASGKGALRRAEMALREWVRHSQHCCC